MYTEENNYSLCLAPLRGGPLLRKVKIDGEKAIIFNRDVFGALSSPYYHLRVVHVCETDIDENK